MLQAYFGIYEKYNENFTFLFFCVFFLSKCWEINWKHDAFKYLFAK